MRYVNDVRYGSIESLRQIPARAVLRVEWLSASDATPRFGTGHQNGTMVVTTGAPPRGR